MSDAPAEDPLAAAEAAEDRTEALRLAGEAVADELLKAMKDAKIPKADQSIAALRSSGLHALLAEAMGVGKLRYVMVERELNRFRTALADRALSANDIKLGILAFDEAAQRLSLVGGKASGFVYAVEGSRARDSLITFARSLHR